MVSDSGVQPLAGSLSTTAIAALRELSRSLTARVTGPPSSKLNSMKPTLTLLMEPRTFLVTALTIAFRDISVTGEL